MNRPRLLLGVLGTHTEVGKTWVSVRLLELARRRGLRVAARKPVQSFDPQAGAPPRDAEQLAGATGERSEQVCDPLRSYEVAMAPPMAADCLGRQRITAAALLAELTWQPQLDLGVVESVGGPRSPLAHDADSIEFLERIRPDRLLLVSDAALGSLNAIRLSLACLPALPVHVLLNRFDDTQVLHRLNRSWLLQHYGIHTHIEVDELLDALLAAN